MSAHHHDHAHTPHNKRILATSCAIISVYMIIEFLGGHYFHSLTLLADAGHMANDSLSLLLALLALYLSERKQRWFALLNGLSLIAVSAYIVYEAVQRWQNPPVMLALSMLAVAVTGLLVNILVAWLMLKGDHDNLNLKAAYLHVLADMFGSVVAIIAGLSAWLLGWQWVDTVASLILGFFVLKSGAQVTHEAWHELHEPEHLHDH